MMMRLTCTAALCVLAGLGAATAQQRAESLQQGGAAALHNTRWATAPGRSAPPMQLHFQASPGEPLVVFATVGCNTVRSAIVWQPDGSMRFGGGAMTLLACRPGLAEAEAAMLQSLGATRQLRLSAYDELLLLDEAEGTAAALTRQR